MTMRDLADRPVPWLSGEGDRADLVVSSRARLARNLAGEVFPHRADDAALERIFDRVRDASVSVPRLAGATEWALDSLPEWGRRVLMERHLVSGRHVRGRGRRGVIECEEAGLALAVNEEDHLRIQGVAPGLNPSSALQATVELDRALEGALGFAARRDLGYLTSCPTNVGTGLRVSVLVHLPGLALTGEVKRVHQAVGEMGMTVRGWFGEGSRALGDFWQVSNQRTLGLTEEDAVETLERVVDRVLELELEARERAAEETARRRRLEDRVHRSRAVLESARMITASHAMACASDVRLGKWLGHFEEVPWSTLNELSYRVQPAHLGAAREEVPEPEDAEWLRARWIRRRMQGRDGS
jgi:protein arginine kinase